MDSIHFYNMFTDDIPCLILCCQLHDISHKYIPSCVDKNLNMSFIRPLLIVAVQRSGTIIRINTYVLSYQYILSFENIVL